MILGLVGFIGSGKGTVGDILTTRGFHKDSFAAPLKDAIAIMFGWPRDLLEGDTEVSRQWREQPDPFWSQSFGKPFTPRLALQLMGTEAGRNVFHLDIWVLSLLNRAKGKNVVVSDVRFKNEMNYIQKNNGIVIRIKRGPEPIWYEDYLRYNTEGGEKPKYDIHISETDWIGCHFDYTINNDGNIHQLEQKVDDMLQEIVVM
jgi:hypothetical protein